jgi:acyl carrier protein
MDCVTGGGLFMTDLTLTGQTKEMKKGVLANNICVYIAEHVGVEVKDVGLDTHLGNDLGLDQFDVVELTILVEEQFADGKIADEGDEIESVGDLIRHIQTARAACMPRIELDKASTSEGLP